MRWRSRWSRSADAHRQARLGLSHAADGTLWPFAGSPRYLPGWIRYRLAEWFDESGRLREGLQLPSAVDAARTAQLRATQERARQEYQAGIAQERDVTGQAMRDRTILADNPETARGLARHQTALARRARRAATLAGAGQAGPDSVAAAEAEALATKPTLRLVESEDVFRREVVDRHALPTTRWASEPEREYAPDDPDAVAADLAWLISKIRPTTPDTTPAGA